MERTLVDEVKEIADEAKEIKRLLSTMGLLTNKVKPEQPDLKTQAGGEKYKKPLAAPEDKPKRAGYINGERVYIFGRNGRIATMPEKSKWDDVQVVKHRDIVRMLNRFLKTIEIPDGQAWEGASGIGQLLYSVMASFHRNGRWVPVEVRSKDITFDDPQKIRLAKMPRLKSEQRIDKTRLTPVVIKGGLYKTPEAKEVETDDTLSGEFKAWQRKQGKPDHHADA